MARAALLEARQPDGSMLLADGAGIDTWFTTQEATAIAYVGSDLPFDQAMTILENRLRFTYQAMVDRAVKDSEEAFPCP